MFGRQADRFAKAERPGFHDAGFALTAFSLVGGQNDRQAGLAQQLREGFVVRRDADPRIDQEEAKLRLRNCGLGLCAHAGFETVVVHAFIAGRVDQDQRHGGKVAFGLLAVAGDTRLVVDQRNLFSGEPVEERGLADIGASDDSEFERHGRPVT